VTDRLRAVLDTNIFVSAFLSRRPEQVKEFLSLVVRFSEWVEVPAEAVHPVIAEDPADDPVLACAVLGNADYLVTYDAHFNCLGGSHEGIEVVSALPFLWALRGDRAPSES
jgi:predicted nucleic acid-binding protein